MARPGEQDRWPRGTPIAPGGRGPGGGRFRSGREALDTPPLQMGDNRIGVFDRGFADLDLTTQAFTEFRGATYGLINQALQGQLEHPRWAAPPAIHEKARRYAEAIKEAMRQSRLPHGIVVHRGMRAIHLFGLPEQWDDLTGREWTDPAYVSTSANSGIGEPVAILRPRSYTGGYTAMDFVDRATQYGGVGDAPGGMHGLALMSISVPAGVGAVQLSPWEWEAEVLLDHGLRYRVTQDNGWETVETRDGPAQVRMLDVEVVPGDWAEQATRGLS